MPAVRPSSVGPRRRQRASLTAAAPAVSLALVSSRASRRSTLAQAASLGWRTRNCRLAATSSLFRAVACKPSISFSMASLCRACVVCSATNVWLTRINPNTRPLSWYRSISFSITSAASAEELRIFDNCDSSFDACCVTGSTSFSPTAPGASSSAPRQQGWRQRPELCVKVRFMYLPSMQYCSVLSTVQCSVSGKQSVPILLRTLSSQYAGEGSGVECSVSVRKCSDLFPEHGTRKTEHFC